MTYQIRKYWHFHPEMSNGTLEDRVTTINVPVLVSMRARAIDLASMQLVNHAQPSLRPRVQIKLSPIPYQI